MIALDLWYAPGPDVTAWVFYERWPPSAPCHPDLVESGEDRAEQFLVTVLWQSASKTGEYRPLGPMEA